MSQQKQLQIYLFYLAKEHILWVNSLLLIYVEYKMLWIEFN